MNMFELIHNTTDINDCFTKLLDMFEEGWACERCPAYGICSDTNKYQSCYDTIYQWLTATTEIEKKF